MVARDTIFGSAICEIMRPFRCSINIKGDFSVASTLKAIAFDDFDVALPEFMVVEESWECLPQHAETHHGGDP